MRMRHKLATAAAFGAVLAGVVVPLVHGPAAPWGRSAMAGVGTEWGYVQAGWWPLTAAIAFAVGATMVWRLLRGAKA